MCDERVTRGAGMVARTVRRRNMGPLGVVLAGVLFIAGTPGARAEPPCSIPNDLALTDIALPAAKRQVQTDKRLTVLTFGGTREAQGGTRREGASYPAQLEAALRAALPGIAVDVRNVPPPGRISADVPPRLPALLATTGATLVIWGPGGRDVMAHADLDVFRDAVNQGIVAVREAGADLILLDTTFVPSQARMAAIEAYRNELLAAAGQQHVPLLRRHALMRLWSDDGTLNLAARDAEERDTVARHLFSCVAQGLAGAIAAAVR